MKNAIKYWWLILIKGIILILLAIYVFVHPVSALIGLALYVGIVLLITGLSLTSTALLSRKIDDDWGWRLAEGCIDVLFALILLTNPGVTAAVFPFIVGFWIIVYGIILFVNSLKTRKEGASNWWAKTITGILAVLLGYLITTDLLAGAIAITFWIGLGFLIFGFINIWLSIQLKNLSFTEESTN